MVWAWFSQPWCLRKGTAQGTLMATKAWLFSHVPCWAKDREGGGLLSGDRLVGVVQEGA